MKAFSTYDGMAVQILKDHKIPVAILTSENNKAVLQRAKKLKIPVLQGVDNKTSALKSLLEEKNYKMDCVLYVGNDLNDYNVIKACGFSVCPADSHPAIKDIVDVVLKTPGGMGVARELLEEVLYINFIEILYNN